MTASNNEDRLPMAQIFGDLAEGHYWADTQANSLNKYTTKSQVNINTRDKGEKEERK